MSITLSRFASTIARNGSSSLILQCRKLVFTYCEHGGSSRGFLEWLQADLAKFAKAHPQIEIVVQPRPAKHPVVTGHYLNGRDKAICVRNLDRKEIQEKIDLLRDSSGSKMMKVKRPVQSTTPSVRGIYSSFHAKPLKI